MDIVKRKWKNMVMKVWDRFCNTSRSPTSPNSHRAENVAPEGCFFVYVGPQRRRFVIKAEIANHPSFQMLLEDAELEYGFSNEGPLLLPCDVDLFNRVLAEIDNGEDREMTPICSFAYSRPARRPTMNKGHGSYKLLTPS
ncbi:FBD-associated F-box protein [Hibiscus syriacus]|uniref:FBD-associated F-box protein n=1 Tax=Hibiscus syriacus TaxID=106335 RepID=A0A6A2WGX6_HIBSY|nr:auxin-responsive protein SAUR71-like [Hibiscus syriacus]KAE8657151.1 FBD-associated F-box protein [Hibiscus syriacus]